jgi:hypothetical protein
MTHFPLNIKASGLNVSDLFISLLQRHSASILLKCKKNIANLQLSYYSSRIRPLRVSPLVYPEHAQKSWGFFLYEFLPKEVLS